MVKAWTVVKGGMYTASSAWWMVNCVSKTKREAWAKARSLAGVSDKEMKAGGLEAMRIEINVAE